MFFPDAVQERYEHPGTFPERTLFRFAEFVALIDKKFGDQGVILHEEAGAAVTEVIDLGAGMGFMELTHERRRKKDVPNAEGIDDEK